MGILYYFCCQYFFLFVCLLIFLCFNSNKCALITSWWAAQWKKNTTTHRCALLSLCESVRPCIHLQFVKMLIILEPPLIFWSNYASSCRKSPICRRYSHIPSDAGCWLIYVHHVSYTVTVSFRSEKANLGQGICTIGSEPSLSTWCRLVNQRGFLSLWLIDLKTYLLMRW